MNTFFDLPKPHSSALKRSHALGECIRQAIHQQGGCISFAAFMDLALYHPRWGYYCTDTFDLGKRGDFTTAAEISPLYAGCFARQALQLFAQLKQGQLLEIGAGTGRFAGDLLLELKQLGVKFEHYYIYEISAALRKKQQHFLKTHCPELFHHFVWLETLPPAFTGMIIANEVLDALPVHCFRVEQKQIMEKCVTTENDQFIWINSTPTTSELTLKANHLRKLYALENGYESEINLHLASFISQLTQVLSQGTIVLADYGYGQQEYYHPLRQHGTLTCFYQHRHHNHPLILPGLQDITAHVDFTRVAEEAIANQCQLAGFSTQAAFLLSCGLIDMAEEKEKALSEIDAFHLHQSIKSLTLPSEMGERVKIMALSKKIDIELLGFRLQDRRRDL